MKNNILTNYKFTVLVIVIVLGLFTWAETTSFKLFKSEYGTKYAPNLNHGSVHHK